MFSPLTGTLDLDGNELILDGDGDTSITASVDDQIDYRLGGADDFRMTANKFDVLAGSTLKVTGIETLTKGSDVASATDLLVNIDGNIFDVTGTTTIATIATKGVGTVIKLHFDAILTLTHHATNLILPGGANITTAAGDEAEFYEYASADWRCTKYTKASGKAVIETASIANMVEDTSPQLGGDLDLNGKNIDFPTTANISDCLDEDDMASDSATMLSTQQAIKAYVDTTVKVAPYDFTETGDISIATVTPTGTLWSSSQSITIPTNGIIQIHPHLRIDNASGGTRNYSIGLRINGTDYFPHYDANGTPVYAESPNVSTGNYIILKGGVSGGGISPIAFDITGLGISTGSQTVQPIIGVDDSTATQTLKGTTVTARLKVAITDMT